MLEIETRLQKEGTILREKATASNVGLNPLKRRYAQRLEVRHEGSLVVFDNSRPAFAKLRTLAL